MSRAAWITLAVIVIVGGVLWWGIEENPEVFNRAQYGETEVTDTGEVEPTEANEPYSAQEDASVPEQRDTLGRPQTEPE